MRIQIVLEPNLSPQSLVELGMLAEAAGVDGLWVQNYATGPDPFMSLVPLALASSRLQLGVVVVSPQEIHPLKLATSLLTLHEYSRGRANVVMGRGGEWIGVMQGDFRPRVAPLQEAIQIVRAAAESHGRPLTLPGTHYRARFYRSPWRTVPAPPRVYAGVTRDRMLTMAATTAHGAMLADVAPPTVVAERVRRARATAPSTFRMNDFVGWHVKPTRVAAEAEARRELIIRAWLSPYWLRPFLTQEEIAFVQTHKRVFVDAYRSGSSALPGIPPELIAKLIDGLSITGGMDEPDRIRSRVEALQQAGLDELALRIHDEPAASIRWIGAHVLHRQRATDAVF